MKIKINNEIVFLKIKIIKKQLKKMKITKNNQQINKIQKKMKVNYLNNNLMIMDPTFQTMKKKRQKK